MEYFQGFTSIGDSPQDQKKTPKLNFEPGNFEERIIFMSMFNDIDWTKEAIQKDAFQILNTSRITRRDSREDTGHSLAPAMKRSGTELSTKHLKDTRIPSPQRWWDVSKKLVTQYPRASVLRVVEF